MSIAFVKQHGVGNDKSTSSPYVSLQLTSVVPAGHLIVAMFSFDNVTATTPTIDPTTLPTVAGDDVNNWVQLGYHDSSNSGSGGGVRTEIWAIVTSVDWGGYSFNVSLTASVTCRAWAAMEFSGAGTKTIASGTGTSTGGTPSAAAAATAAGQLVIGGAAFENNAAPTADSDTTFGSWSAAASTFTTGQGATANIAAIMQYKIVSAAGTQTYNPTGSGDSGSAIGIVDLAAVPDTPTSAPTVSVTGPEQVTVTVPAKQGGATSYDVYRSDGAYVGRAAALGTVVDKNAICTGSATYAVKGRNPFGVSANQGPSSSAVMADPAAPAFAPFPASKSMSVWAKAKSYDATFAIYRGPSGGARTLVHTSGVIPAGQSLQWLDTGLTDGTTYDYSMTVTVSTPTSRTSAESSVQSAAPAKWTQLAAPPQDQSNSGVAYLNGLVYVIGGYDPSSTAIYLKVCYTYDPTTKTWASITSLPDFGSSGTNGRYGPAVTTYNGKIYCSGGGDELIQSNQFAEYDPSTNKWTVLAASSPFYRASALPLVYGTKLYIIGGQEHSTPDPRSVWVYDFANPGAGWVQQSTLMPFASSSQNVTASGVVIGSKALVTAQQANNTDPSAEDLFWYDFAADTWTVIPIPSWLKSDSGDAGVAPHMQYFMHDSRYAYFTFWYHNAQIQANVVRYDYVNNVWYTGALDTYQDSDPVGSLVTESNISLDGVTVFNVAPQNTDTLWMYAPPVPADVPIAALAGSGTLSAKGTVVASAALSGSGSLVATKNAATNLAGSGDLAAVGAPAVVGTADLSGGGTLQAQPISQATFGGSGTLTAEMVQTATADLSGSGALTAQATITVPAHQQPMRFTSGLGYFSLPTVMVLSIPDPQLDYAPTAVVVYLSGAPEGAVVTFAVGGVDVATVTAGADLIGPLSLPVDDQTATQVTARADGCICSPVTISFTGTAPADVTAPGPDADPVSVPAAVVDGTIYRWVLQDLMPGGLGSYVFPANPKSMMPLPVEKTLAAEHTTAIAGQFHVTEAAWQPVEWSFSGVSTTKEFYDTIQQYFALNRRFYLVDHRNRAWIVTFLEPDFEFRLRSEVDGVLTDWVADYTVNAVIYEQTPKTPA